MTVPGDLIGLIDRVQGLGPPLSKRPAGSMLPNGAGDDTRGADVEELPNPDGRDRYGKLEPRKNQNPNNGSYWSVIIHRSAIKASQAFNA